MKADRLYIKSIVSMSDIMRLYNLKPQRNNKYICPFHDEKTPSFSVKQNIYNCFGCGSKGDIFDFTMKMNNCDFSAALDYICAAFGIPNDDEATLEQRREFARAIQARQKASQERESLRETGRHTYNRLCAYRRWLATQEPPMALDDIHNEYVERCQTIDYIDYLLDEYISDMEQMGRDFPDADAWLKRIRKKWAG